MINNNDDSPVIYDDINNYDLSIARYNNMRNDMNRGNDMDMRNEYNRRMDFDRNHEFMRRDEFNRRHDFDLSFPFWWFLFFR